MPTRIRTLKKIITLPLPLPPPPPPPPTPPPPPPPPPTPPPPPPPPPIKQPRESQTIAMHRNRNDLTALFYHDSQRRKTNEAAATLASMNKISSSIPSDNTTSTQKSFAADTSHDTSALMNSDIYSDRKRKSSSLDYEELVRERRARSFKKNKICSVNGCAKFVVNGGVCVRHGAQVKRCSSDGCENQAQTGGVCRRHGATMKMCSIEGCGNQAKRRGLCRRHGAFR